MYYVLTSTNLAAPLAGWIRASTNSFDANGKFMVTNAVSTGVPRQFYRLLVP
jgi:predicted alpha/beta hydrolase